jgi:hypothetical protein
MDYSIEGEESVRELDDFGSIKWRPDWELTWEKEAKRASAENEAGHVEELFIPKSEWQMVPDWAVPIGGDYEFDIREGKKWMRWREPIPGPETVFDTRTQKCQQRPPGESIPPAPENTTESSQENDCARYQARSPELDKRIYAYLDTVEEAIDGQGGSNPTYRVACILTHGFALRRKDALYFMRYYSQTKCKPPWSRKEMEHKVDSALKATDHKLPRGYLLGEEVAREPEKSSPGGGEKQTGAGSSKAQTSSAGKFAVWIARGPRSSRTSSRKC